MKQLFSVSFVVILTVQAFHLTLPYAFYGVASNYIVDNFCVNKAKAEVMCSGKCYTDSLLESEASKEESKRIPFSIEKITLSPCEIALPYFDTSFIFIERLIILPLYHTTFNSLELILAILKPPINL